MNMRTLTFQANVNLDEIDGNLRRAVEVLTEALEAEDMVDSAWQITSNAMVVIVSDGGNLRVYGPFQNADEAEEAIEALPDQYGVSVALHDPDAINL